LKEAQRRLQIAHLKRAELLKRPGGVISATGSDNLDWQAQALWSNSSDRGLPMVDAEIKTLEQETSALLETARDSYKVLNGLDILTETASQEASFDRAKKEELSQEAIVGLQGQLDRPR